MTSSPTSTASAGRAGRGRSGEAILFVAPRERNMLRLIEHHTRQTLEPLRLPTLGDVNARRVAKFKARILEAIGRGDATPYRAMIDDLAAESGIDSADLAAALASFVQGKTPLVLAKRVEEATPAESRGEGRKRRDEAPRRPRSHRHEPQLTYRLAVGRKHGVQPGNIVGAIANVGGIEGSDINGLDIQRDCSFVRRPEGIAPETLERLAQVRVRGQLLAITLAEQAPAGKKRKYGR